MLFCLGNEDRTKSPGYQKNNCIFNVQVSYEEWDEARSSLPTIKISHTYWVDKRDMSDKEKLDNPIYKETGGYLKQISYKDAWANWWEDASKKDKQAILDLPHFNSEIFEGITGIEVKSPNKENNPKEIIIDGATYVLKENL